MGYVIIGCSYAAVGAVDAIREVDAAGKIIVVADESYGAYCRPLLPHYLEGEMSLEEIYYRRPKFFTQMRVETRLSQAVTRIDPAGHQVILADGSALVFDRLLIAAGGKAAIPPTPGSDAKGVFTLTRLDDAHQMSAWVRRVGIKEAVIIGTGLICLNTLRALTGMKMTLVELLPRVMGLALDDEASRIVEQRLKEHGIDVRTSTTVTRILRNRKRQVRAVTLSTGEELPCQMVLFAVGVRPNLALVEGSGLEVKRGIVVDERMQTSAPGVYAAGDVVEAYDIVNEERRVIAILPLAYEQGRVAGWNMAGREARYAGGLALNAMSLFGLPIMTMGITLTDDRPETFAPLSPGLTLLVHHTDGVYRKLVFRGDALVGAILIGDVAGGGVLTGLIKSRQPVTFQREQLLRGAFVDYQVARQAGATRKMGAWARPPGGAAR